MDERAENGQEMAALPKLRGKQQAFVEHYLTCWNATEAAKLAGYSEKTAKAIGSENLSKPDIQKHITARLDELKMGADEVLTRLGEHARGSLADFITVQAITGRIDIDFRKAQEAGKLHLLKKFKRTVSKDGEVTLEFELYDAQAALVHLGKHHRLFAERVEHSGPDGEALSDARDQLARALDRIADRIGAARPDRESDAGGS